MRLNLLSNCLQQVTAAPLPASAITSLPYVLKSIFKTRKTFQTLVLMCVFSFSVNKVLADYTVAQGATIDATTIVGQSGVLTVNGRLNISSNVALLGFSSVVINGPSGQIYWTSNADLSFSANTTIAINNPALGLQPTIGNGNASQRLIVGTTIISVSSDNSNNAAFSFEQFNALGGLPQFTISGNNSVCAGTPIVLTATPDKTSTVSYTYAWSISGSTANFTPAQSTSFTSATTTITPPAGAYTITCTVKATGDALATKTFNISVNSASTPSVSATAASICSGSSSTLVATSAGNTIDWYTAASGGTSIGTTASGAGFNVAPTSTTTYYAQARTAGGCVNSTRTSIAVTVGNLPTAFTLSGGGTYCDGSTGVAVSLSGSQTGVNYQLKRDNINTGTAVAGTGAVIQFGAQTITGAYTVVATNATTACSTTMTGSAMVALKTKPTAAISGTQLICNGSSAQLSIAVTGAAPWTGTLSNGQPFTGTSSPIAVTVNPTAMTTYSIVSISDANCSATAPNLSGSATISVGNYGEWRGITSNWNDGQNWCTGVAPVNGMNVVVPVTSNNPVIDAGIALANNLTIATGATLTLNGGTLKIAGTINSSQAIIVTGGTIELNGTSSQTIAGSNFLSNSIKNLTISNSNGIVVSATLNDSLKVSGAISFGNVNNSTISTNDNLVLVSNASGTARVADITNKGVNTGNKFTGKVTVRRYFPARRAWRLFTAPVSAGGSIYDNWQNKGVYKQGVGTYVSGTTATNPMGANGLDWSLQNNSSLKTGTNLTSVSNTRTSMLSKNAADTSDNIPYFIFVRGDRHPDNTNPLLSNTTTLNSVGKLQTGRQTFNVSSSYNGYTLIGNPYAAPVDLDSLVRKNVAKRFYMWDPYLNAEQGGYILFDDFDEDGNYSISPQSPGGLTKILQSGQAFFVQTASNNPASVTFQETAKSTSNTNNGFRPVGSLQAFRVNLNAVSGTKSTLLDGVYAAFDKSFNKEVDIQDALKFGNVKEMLAIERDAHSLTIERRPAPGVNDTLHLALTRTSKRSYQFEFIPTGLDPTLSVVLIDSYTGLQKELSAVTPAVVNFEINEDAASAAPNRFKVVFKKLAPIELPLTFTSVTAKAEPNNVAVTWSVENETEAKVFEVERSTDGLTFRRVYTSVATNSSSYSWTDLQPVPGHNYYRIQALSRDGKIVTSKIVSTQMLNRSKGARVYPNPVTEGIIAIEFKNMAAGKYKARLINSVGQTMLFETITHVAGSSKEYIRPAFNLPAGMYQLEISEAGKPSFALSVVVQ